MGRRKVRTRALRGEMVAAALRLLAVGGVTAVTTRAVAAGAGSSLAAVNELFGGKAGLVRAMFAAGFARLADDLAALEAGADPEADVIELALAIRAFARSHPHLYEVMFSRPFAEFQPDAQDGRAAEVIYRIVLDRVGAVLGAEAAKDAAIGLFAVVQGLVSMESSGLLGGSAESVDRRFRSTVIATLRGFAEGSGAR